MPASQLRYPMKLTLAQRKFVAEIVPELVDRLKLSEKPQRTIDFTPAELKLIRTKAGAGELHGSTGMVRNSLRHVTDLATQTLERSQGIGSIPVAERLYQFKITLKDSHPPIWRRIQIKDCTLDKLHEHIQTAIGWTNSHLHHFQVGEQLYGDPMLLQENFGEMSYEDSTNTKISGIVPKSGKQFRIEYEYDFGDGWMHEVMFEGCTRAEPGGRYPVCMVGARACPPEDVGGVWGYQEFQQALADPQHERHDEFSEWIGGSFDAEAFAASMATKKMRRGLPDWRTERWL